MSTGESILNAAIEEQASQTAATAATAERAALRKQLLADRRAMEQPYRLHKSAVICEQLLLALDTTLALTNAQGGGAQPIVAVYSAFPDEVQLDDFIRGAYDRGVGVAFPCMIPDAQGTNDVQQTMEMRLVDAKDYQEGTVYFLNHPLKRYTHDAPEIAPQPYVAADDLLMAVIPLVGFDAQGNRLGYGKGNYDRYLTQLEGTSCRIVGVAFEEQRVDAVPIEPHDVALPAIIAR